MEHENQNNSETEALGSGGYGHLNAREMRQRMNQFLSGRGQGTDAKNDWRKVPYKISKKKSGHPPHK